MLRRLTRCRTLLLLVVLLGVFSCSAPGVPQRDPLLPVPVRRPEVEVTADRVPGVLEDSHSVLEFRGRLVDRIDPGRLERTGALFARVALVFELEPEEIAAAPLESMTTALATEEPDVATILLSAPFGNLPLLRIGDVHQVRWDMTSDDPMGLPDLRVEIRSEDGRLIYLMSSGSSLPQRNLLPELELLSARRPLFLTDFEAGTDCRVRRRHYSTRVKHHSLEGGEAWLMPTDQVVLSSETGSWRLTMLDNSVALKGGCDKLVAQELAHRTVVLQYIE